MILLRRMVGDVLRRHRQRQARTLREVSASAKVSLGYLSEVERGRKEASSELLGSICAALGVSLADVLREVSDDLASIERRGVAPIGFVPMVAGEPRVARVPVAAASGVRDAHVASLPVRTAATTTLSARLATVPVVAA